MAAWTWTTDVNSIVLTKKRRQNTVLYLSQMLVIIFTSLNLCNTFFIMHYRWLGPAVDVKTLFSNFGPSFFLFFFWLDPWKYLARIPLERSLWYETEGRTLIYSVFIHVY